MNAPTTQKPEIEYPESDGEPMGETEFHINQLFDFLIHPLKERYWNKPDAYVVSRMFLYYEEGNPRAVVDPDLYVVFGVPKKVRRTYKSWEEGKVPDVIFDLISEKTYRVDLGEKRFLYEELGVKEYFLFDPLSERLRPPLQGFRLVEDYYMPLVPNQVSPGVWELPSEQLGLILRTVDNNLRFYDPQTEQYLLTRSEESEARRMAEKVQRQEEASWRLAEAKLEEAEAEIARLKKLLGE